MRRPVAILAFAALTSSQLVALRCDMGASTHHGVAGDEAASAHGAATHEAARAHQAATPEAVRAHETAGHETGRAHETAGHSQTAPAHGSPHHGAGDSCPMMMACGAATISPARSVMSRIPAVFVRTAYKVTPVLATADLAVETPPPRLTV